MQANLSRTVPNQTKGTGAEFEYMESRTTSTSSTLDPRSTPYSTDTRFSLFLCFEVDSSEA